MFTEIAPLLRSCSQIRIDLIASGDGLIKMAMTPITKGSKEPALSHPLFLAGTPEDLDAEFVAAIAKYSAARASLVEQVEATATVLKAAEKTQADKATKPSKTLSTRPAAPKQSDADQDLDDSEDEENEDDATSGNGTPPADAEDTAPTSTSTSTSTSAPAPQSGTNLLSLI